MNDVGESHRMISSTPRTAKRHAAQRDAGACIPLCVEHVVVLSGVTLTSAARAVRSNVQLGGAMRYIAWGDDVEYRVPRKETVSVILVTVLFLPIILASTHEKRN